MPHPGEPTQLAIKVTVKGLAISLAAAAINTIEILWQTPGGTITKSTATYPAASEVMFNGDVCAGDGTDGWIKYSLTPAQHATSGKWKYWGKYTLTGADGPYYTDEFSFVSRVRQSDP